ncbi:transcriptional regulator [Caballeronia turbans]|nr:transcriptional regulator [Caballeronia turbans]
MKNHRWTEQEDSILRGIWKSSRPVKEQMHLLPRRSERAMLVRAQALGITGGRNVEIHARSALLALIQRDLKAGDCLSSPDVAVRFSCTTTHAGVLLGAAHDRKEIHVVEWRRTRPVGPYVAVYAWGNKPDAIKPQPKTKQEYNRRRYINKRAKQGKLVRNVFGVAMAQVAGFELPAVKQSHFQSRVYMMEAA